MSMKAVWHSPLPSRGHSWTSSVTAVLHLCHTVHSDEHMTQEQKLLKSLEQNLSVIFFLQYQHNLSYKRKFSLIVKVSLFVGFVFVCLWGFLCLILFSFLSVSNNSRNVLHKRCNNFTYVAYLFLAFQIKQM